MRKQRRRPSAASPQQLFEQDWQSFTTQFPEFLDETALRAFGRRADEPEMDLNSKVLFGFCVWQQVYGKGNADVRGRSREPVSGKGSRSD
jgi:hypothetical protein